MLLIKNVIIFDGINLYPSKYVVLQDDKIIQISNNIDWLKDSNIKVIDGQENILAPGFIDLQLNGGNGIYFNEAPSMQTLNKIFQAHLQFGTTSMLATLISDEINCIQKALSVVEKAKYSQGILGIHLEGPYLNKQRHGIHNSKYLHIPLAEDITQICQADIPCKIVTLAPEIVPTKFISQLVENKVIVFAGHSNASFRQMQSAFSAGLCGITHLFNACSQLTSREPGIVGAALFNQELWCTLIADGLHVDFANLAIALRCKGTEKCILVSDAMSPVGTDMQEFMIQEQKIFVQENRYQNADSTLAGSSLNLHQAVKNIVTNNCASLPQALAMASTNPAKCLNLQHKKGKVQEGLDADLILLDKKNLDIMNIILAGEIIK